MSKVNNTAIKKKVSRNKQAALTKKTPSVKETVEATVVKAEQNLLVIVNLFLKRVWDKVWTKIKQLWAASK